MEFVMKNLVDQYLVDKELELRPDEDSDSGLGVKFKWYEVTPEKGILLIMDTIFEGHTFDDTVECNPVVKVFSKYDSEDCIKAIKAKLKDYFDCEDIEYSED